MAYMYPERLSQWVLNDPKRSAERKVYDALSVLSKKYLVFYSVSWQSRDPKLGVKDGEADFVVVHPDQGILILEVKGGEISYKADTEEWFSKDRYGVLHEIKDPVEQARKSRYELLAKLQDLPEWGTRWSTIGHAVVFPDIVLKEASFKPDLSADIVIDHKKLADIGSALDQVFAYYRADYSNGGALGYERLEMVTNLLGRSFELRTPLGVDLDYEENQLVQLTEQQMRILGFLGRRRRAAIKGCAGSGKTMLAVEKATRLANQGFDVLLTCFNYALARDLQNRVPENVTVLHFHGLCREMANEVGFGITSYANEEEYYSKVLPEALLEAAEKTGPMYDAIVIDEGQDFQENWLAILSLLLRDEKTGIFFVFFDDNQNLYQGMDRIPGIIDEESFPLTENCRNTKAIHQLVAKFHHDPQDLISLGPDGRAPQISYYQDDFSMKKFLSKLLHTLVNEEAVLCEDIVILTPRSQDRSALQHQERVGIFTLVYNELTRNNQILVSSIHGFKGLERKVVILTEVETHLKTSPDTVFYVGCSRAKTQLYIMMNANADEAIKARISSVNTE